MNDEAIPEERDPEATRIDTPRRLAEPLRERRRSLGYTQAECAALADVSVEWLSRLEGGKPSCPFNLILQLVDALDMALILRPNHQVAGPPVAASGNSDGC